MSSAGARLLVVVLIAGTAVATIAHEEAGQDAPLESTAVAVPTAGGELRGALSIAPAFRVDGTRVGVAARGEPAQGTPEAPLALARAAVGSTALTTDHWTLSFDLEQEAAAEGAYEARLVFNGADAGAIVVAAEDVGAGATLVFDLGASIPRSSVYVLTLAPVETLAAVELEIASAPNGSLAWVGRGEREGETNPTLEARAGVPLRLTWHNDDGVIHDLAVQDADRKTLAGPTKPLDAKDASETLSWTPPAPGELTYLCRFHAASMRGTLRIV